MTDLNDLVVNLKYDIETNANKSVGLDYIYSKESKRWASWIQAKQKEFKENKDKMVNDSYKLSFVKENNIPFKALRLTMDDLVLRNDIFTELYLKHNINQTNIMRFLENIYLFFDVTEEKEITEIIHELLCIKEDNDSSREVLERLKVKMMTVNNIRKEFDPNQFVRDNYNKIPMVGMCFREHGRPYYCNNGRGPVMKMAIREHGQPYRNNKHVITKMAIREHGRPFDSCVIN